MDQICEISISTAVSWNRSGIGINISLDLAPLVGRHAADRSDSPLLGADGLPTDVPTGLPLTCRLGR